MKLRRKDEQSSGTLPASWWSHLLATKGIARDLYLLPQRAPGEILIERHPLLQLDPGEHESAHRLDCWSGLVLGTTHCLVTSHETGWNSWKPHIFYPASYDGRHHGVEEATPYHLIYPECSEVPSVNNILLLTLHFLVRLITEYFHIIFSLGTLHD